ncbi:hypothetical protein SAMN05518668_1026 [Sphingobium sp. YR657]|uniref:hypothetical protein n=1 Tax=Sphingobium sp. YR657 TaxID=1884366 RepID=UPI00091DEF86|nr:hypothetical protein [Sphingobium sp. YR657]SHL59696.1 hypothetical protein SAMN05518668_1026 [Sphingobium sp. YR657]
MISFPFLQALKVEGYQLYPGPAANQKMDIKLGPGPWLILGVNGLGKSTLLLLMRNLLGGAVRVRPAGFGGDRSDLQSLGDRFFAVRVADDARHATADLEVRLGDAKLSVSRRLSNLGLTSATVTYADGSVEILGDDATYRLALTRLMHLETFEDVLRVLDHIVFFLEARRSLIWDQAAQFEIFRALLMPDQSAKLRALEGKIVSADSSARNVSAVIYKMTQDHKKESNRQQSEGETRAKLSAVQAGIHELTRSAEVIREELDGFEEERDSARLQLKRSDAEVSSAIQEYERLKFDTLRFAFKDISPTQQYLFLKLVTERVCFACGQAAEDTAALMQGRLDGGLCPVCGAEHAHEGPVSLPEGWREQALAAYEKLEASRATYAENQKTYDDRAVRAEQHSAQLAEIKRQIEGKRLDAHKLSKLLPDGDAEKLDKQQSRIAAFMEQMKDFQAQRAIAENDIQALLADLKRRAEEISGRLQSRFDEIAKPFFAERVRLIYAPRDVRIGQTGKPFQFPAFEVEMTSGATHGDYVRRKAEQVSLSQRDYLDIIFRMVLLDVLGDAGGSLVVDGPEGSVDAVFAERAGELFASFASAPNSNAILACNIVEGSFIPETLQNYADEAKRARVINLLDQAVPTAALETLRPLYMAKITQILGGGT